PSSFAALRRSEDRMPLADVRSLAAELAATHPRAAEALAELAEERAATDARLQEVATALFALASLDFAPPPTPRNDGTVLDAVVGCVGMLHEELAAYAEHRTRVEYELERRVG